MTERERLPDRRVSELVDFEHGGRKWTATFGRFADGRIAEVFLDAPKESPLVELAQDGALAASLALQSGCPLETLRHALSGREAGPLRIALALIDAYQVQHKDSQQTGADFRVTYGSSCKATQLGGMENAPKGLARMILAEQVREALGHNEGED